MYPFTMWVNKYCMAGVKRGRERGNLGVRERAKKKGKESSPPPSPPSLVHGLAPSIPFPFECLPRKLILI